MMKISQNECIRYLKEQDDFLIITHIRPDGDTLGSAAALCHILRTMGKTAYLYDNPQTTDTYKPWVSAYIAEPGFVPGCVVAVDLASETLFPKGFDPTTVFQLCIDHHPTNTGYAQRVYCLPDKSSCGEIILMMAQELGIMDKTIANLLYIAVSTDCGCFAYGNTGADTHVAAAELIRAGADIGSLNKILFRTASFSRLMLEGLIYSGMQRFAEGAVAVATVTLDMMRKSGATEDDCDDLASLMGRVAGTRVAVTIRELGENDCKLSLRSGADFDSSAVCAKHGGGGHKMASGCSITANPQQACDMIVRDILEAL